MYRLVITSPRLSDLTATHVVWVGEVVTTIARPGIIMINNIQVHIDV
jgi:hypothetical protein